MKHLTLSLIITASLAILLSACLDLSDPKAASNSLTNQTQIFAYYLADEKVGCYGDPTDSELQDVIITVVYTISMSDPYTMQVCVTVPTTNAGTIPLSTIANKTVNFYVSNSVSNPGESMDLSALKLPSADEEIMLFYTTGTSAPCPDGSGAKLVGYLDMTDYMSYKYVKVYDECGTLVGMHMTPVEAQRQIDAGGK